VLVDVVVVRWWYHYQLLGGHKVRQSLYCQWLMSNGLFVGSADELMVMGSAFVFKA
jgi:hypothetical protein